MDADVAGALVMGQRFGFCSRSETVLRRIGSFVEPWSHKFKPDNCMRIALAVTAIALSALDHSVFAGSLRACAQVSAQVDAAVRPLLANVAAPQPDIARLHGLLDSCLNARNICSVLYNTRYGKEALVAADVTADLPEQDLSEHGKSSVIFLVRSIPRVRNDSNQYCLVSEKFSGTSSVEQWDVYGWVVASGADQPLPLEKQLLEDQTASDPRSLRGLAAALWFFAQRMSGHPPR
jgi:hypothetical protein